MNRRSEFSCWAVSCLLAGDGTRAARLLLWVEGLRAKVEGQEDVTLETWNVKLET